MEKENKRAGQSKTVRNKEQANTYLGLSVILGIHRAGNSVGHGLFDEVELAAVGCDAALAVRFLIGRLNVEPVDVHGLRSVE